MKSNKSNNPNGRPKGRPNRLTTELRQMLSDRVGDEIERLPELMASLDPKDRADLLAKLLKYVVPAVQDVPAEGTNKPNTLPTPYDFLTIKKGQFPLPNIELAQAMRPKIIFSTEPVGES